MYYLQEPYLFALIYTLLAKRSAYSGFHTAPRNISQRMAAPANMIIVQDSMLRMIILQSYLVQFDDFGGEGFGVMISVLGAKAVESGVYHYCGAVFALHSRMSWHRIHSSFSVSGEPHPCSAIHFHIARHFAQASSSVSFMIYSLRDFR